MKLKLPLLYLSLGFFLCFSCSSNSQMDEDEKEMEIKDDTKTDDDDTTTPNKNFLKILSLGDSYTIGESVCETCRFPEQLKDSIIEKIGNPDVALKVIAQTGWTTGVLKSAIEAQTISNDYDLTTLLIGVNNQYQGADFEVFEKELPELITKAISFSKGDIKKIIVVSIPDYAFTPFGNGNDLISKDIDKYNNFIENYCKQYSITYIYITDITRQGLDQPDLVASDRLHPSTQAYTQFVSRMLPAALEKIGYTNE
ncbi:SGNH/GDSL hydrolase family protein [Algibacter sp. 2305UL17-15]|uniref:SGNH/GDSL hydrolase family protein n=1 Tax=Algibacter sp. 2305UL17-15 TaxID=3231268 RepID=UPI00345AC180